MLIANQQNMVYELVIPRAAMRKKRAQKAKEKQISFRYLKSHCFRVIHADGVIGGPSPTGDLHMTVFSQRTAIPRRMVFTLAENGSLGSEIKELKESEPGVVRELEADIIMDITAAKSVIEWLQKHVARMEQAAQAIQVQK
ncbi:MAG TPA: hypothetical protein VEK08_04410 [Planctomycetota bacterium]|nr:hypothetical protein [Planctomycetota bacterium]